MTLLLIALAAVISTLIYRYHRPPKAWKWNYLCLIYWGAFLMWLMDAAFALTDAGAAAYFQAEAQNMISNFWLGLCVVILGLLLWLFVVFVGNRKSLKGRVSKTDKRTGEK